MRLQMAKDPLYDLINSALTLAKDQLPRIHKSISLIVREGIDDPKIIEHQLDEILNYVPLGIGYEEFKQLNKYYRSIDERGAESYEAIFKEFTEDEV